MKEVWLLLHGFVNLLRSIIFYLLFYFYIPTTIYTGEKMKTQGSFFLFIFPVALTDNELLVAFHSPAHQIFRLQNFYPVD